MSAVIIDLAKREITERPLTPEEQAQRDADTAAGDAKRQAADAAATARQQARGAIVPVAQSAVGVRFDQLTAVQVRALVAILLWQGGALDGAGVVQPLASWVRDQ